MKHTNLISADELFENKENIVILDASLNKTKSGVVSPHLGKIIPGAQFFDLKHTFSDQNTDLPNMFPDLKDFYRHISKFGMTLQSQIVVYDNLDMYSSPRVWLMLKSLGYTVVKVLNGGLSAWISKGFPVVNTHSNAKSEHYIIKHLPSKVFCDKEFVESIISSSEFQIIDTRSKVRFDGSKPEPRGNMRSGHIESAINIHYQTLLNNGFLKCKSDLEELLKPILHSNKTLVIYCGSGVTACILFLALEEYFEKDKIIYDGSWSEWGKIK